MKELRVIALNASSKFASLSSFPATYTRSWPPLFLMARPQRSARAGSVVLDSSLLQAMLNPEPIKVLFHALMPL